MNKYPSPIVIMAFALLCVVAGVLLVYGAEKYDNRFSSPSSSTAASIESAAVVYLQSARETWPEVK